MAKFCPNCGNQVPKQQMRFCVACGTEFNQAVEPSSISDEPLGRNPTEADNDADPTTASPITSVPEQTREQLVESSAGLDTTSSQTTMSSSSAKPTNWKRIAIPIAVAAAFLAVVAGGALAFVSGSKDESTPTTSSSAGVISTKASQTTQKATSTSNVTSTRQNTSQSQSYVASLDPLVAE